MIDHDKAAQPLPPAPPDPDFRLRARQQVAEVKQLWTERGTADARTFLAEHPDLATDPAIVISLAYEEYCLRTETAGPPPLNEFCRQFPGHESEVRKVIEAHQLFHEDSEQLLARLQARWPEAGETFLGFVLLRELGRGGFARVFLASQPALGGRRVVVKVTAQGPVEAEILGRLRHPGIVPVHSVHSDPDTGLTLVCMPYLGSATLCDVLRLAFRDRQRPLSPRIISEAIARANRGDEPAEAPERNASLPLRCTYPECVAQLALHMAEALSFIHRHGVCHRDLKPPNVLLSPDGRPMLLDFNLSSDGRSAAVQFAGTIPYMPPEQLRAAGPDPGPPAAVDPRSDLFSLGVIVYELLTGRHPFGPLPVRERAADVCRHLLERQRHGPHPLRAWNPKLDRHLVRIIESCLAFDPAERPESAGALVVVLRQVLGRAAWRRRWLARRVLVPTVVAAVMLLSGMVVASFLPRTPAVPNWIDRGWDCYHGGDFEQAVAQFDQAVEAEPRSSGAWFARGRAYQRLGEFTLALDNFRRADQLVPDGRTQALMGYCAGQLRSHATAVTHYDQALASGYEAAEVFNNRGLSWLTINQWSQAQADLDESIRRNPRLQAPYHNRALLELSRAVKSSERSLVSGIADIEKAMELGPSTAQLYRDAACLHAVAARRDPRHLEPALLHLQKAVELGEDPSTLARDSTLKALLADPRFQTLIQRSRPSHPPQKPVRLLDPVPDPTP